jgi:N-acetylglucosaminyldiphosphoundecaprenol N-acetyl-beta-D-mannosaminyltransferase
LYESGAVDVLGVRISNTTPTGVLRSIEDWIGMGEPRYVCFTPVSGVMAAQRDPAVLEALNGADITAPDGMPMVWSGRYAGARGIERVYGPDTMAAVCERAAAKGWSCFFYGGGEGVAERVAERLQGRFPGLLVAGTRTPPYRPLSGGERDAIAAEITASGAQLVWVGLSTPKQDLWMADMVDRIERPVVLLGVGAAFDIHAGIKRQPPSWLGRLGLAWLYRLLQEPRRLGPRYLVDIPQFLGAIARRRPVLREPVRPASAAPPTATSRPSA